MSISPGGQDRIVWLDWAVRVRIPWEKDQRSRTVYNSSEGKEEGVCFKGATTDRSRKVAKK